MVELIEIKTPAPSALMLGAQAMSRCAADLVAKKPGLAADLAERLPGAAADLVRVATWLRFVALGADNLLEPSPLELCTALSCLKYNYRAMPFVEGEDGDRAKLCLAAEFVSSTRSNGWKRDAALSL